MNFHTTATALALGAVVAASIAVAPTASAKGGGGGDVRSQGSCSSGASWKLKAKADDGAVQVEFEVDSNRVGQRWQVSLTDNAALVFSGVKVTTAPSGSFTVEKRTANRAGADAIRATATNLATGATCRGGLTFSG